MGNNLNIILKFYIILSAFIIAFSLIVLLFTRKPKDELISFYGLFMDMNLKDKIMLSNITLNFLFILFCCLNIHLYNDFCLYIIIVNMIVYLIISFSIPMIIAHVIYYGLLVVILKLLNIINIYFSNVNHDSKILYLQIAFSSLIIGYVLYVSIREIEMIIKRNKFVRRRN